MSYFAFIFFLQNIDHLREIEVVKQLGNILKTNVRGCKSVGHPFVTQLGRIYLDMLNVYRCLSENISVAIAENGEIVTKQPLIRAMRTVKTETLRLISTWVSKSNDAKLVCDNFIPPLLDAVLGDYQRNVPNAREPEVLNTMATFVNKLEVCIDLFLVLFFNLCVGLLLCSMLNRHLALGEVLVSASLLCKGSCLPIESNHCKGTVDDGNKEKQSSPACFRFSFSPSSLQYKRPLQKR